MNTQYTYACYWIVLSFYMSLNVIYCMSLLFNILMYKLIRNLKICYYTDYNYMCIIRIVALIFTCVYCLLYVYASSVLVLLIVARDHKEPLDLRVMPDLRYVHMYIRTVHVESCWHIFSVCAHA